MRLDGIRRILCPTDFSGCARAGLDMAIGLAAQYGAELMACHVLTAPSAGQGPAEVGRADPHDLIKALGVLLEPARAAGTRTRSAIVFGDAAAGIIDHAAAWPADLVIMGSHGQGAREGWSIGSVADQVVRGAPCAVLLLPASAAGRGATPAFRRVLCATDFSGPSRTAVVYGAGLAAASGGELLMLHVMEWFPEANSCQPLVAPEYGMDLSEDARDRLAQAAPEDARIARREMLVTAGRPHREILRLARQRNVDLIVLGVHARRAVDRRLPGTTISHVLRAASCPVLTVRPDAKQDRTQTAFATR
jgi:nucleotide-binding universal stress UspA family protein